MLEQIDMLGEEVVPFLREKFAGCRPAGVLEAAARGAHRCCQGADRVMKLVVVSAGLHLGALCLWRAMACSTTYFIMRPRTADETRVPAD
ncbi:hypothetical protein [Streptomyces variegatus]|uniref:hypothetical protein n=1 Tax=Streptomyces variegatus TaxID=284040 RepID=UPI003C2B7CE4